MLKKNMTESGKVGRIVLGFEKERSQRMKKR